jgi:hypothetical protein
MLQRILLTAVLVQAGCDEVRGVGSRGPTAYAFRDGLLPQPELITQVDAIALATRALLPGEQLATVNSTALDGSGGYVVRVSAVLDDHERDFVVFPDGTTSDPASVYAKNDEDYAAFYGKMTIDLFAQQQELDASASIDFTIRFDGPFESVMPPLTDKLVSLDEFEAWVTSHRAAQRQRLDEIKKPLTEWLGANGATVTNDYRSLPLIQVRAPTAVLRSDFLNTNAAIVEMASTATKNDAHLLGYMGHAALDEQYMTGGNCPIPGRCYGQNLKVGIWEAGATAGFAAISNKHPHFYSGVATTYLNAPVACTSNADCHCGLPDECQANAEVCDTVHLHVCVQEHLTWVAAMLGMYGFYAYPDASRPGNLYTSFSDAGTYDVDFNVANDQSATGMNWLLDTAPVTHVNRSMTGNVGTIAAVEDWAARFQAVFVTLGSNNNAVDNNGNVTQLRTTCSQSWNSLCVGMHEYHSWNDRTSYRWSQYSSYLNDNVTGPGFERPHVLAPTMFAGVEGPYMPDITEGSNACPPIQTTGDLTMNKKSLDCHAITGTSFAAPQAMSAAIQAYQREGLLSALTFPVVRKVVLMASGTDGNADGPINFGTTWSSPSDGIDGAGAIDLKNVVQELDAVYGSIGGFPGQYWWRDFVNADFATSCGTNCKEYVVGTVSVPHGKVLQVAMASNSCTTSRTSTPTMPNNFDLVVVEPGNCSPHLTRLSASAVSEVEMVYDSCMVSAPVPGNGNYAIKVRLIGSSPLNTCGEAGEKVAIAWSLR